MLLMYFLLSRTVRVWFVPAQMATHSVSKRSHVAGIHPFDSVISNRVAIPMHIHSETPPGENQNLFVTLTVRTYVWIVPNWTLQQSATKSTERQVQQVAYQSELWVADPSGHCGEFSNHDSRAHQPGLSERLCAPTLLEKSVSSDADPYPKQVKILFDHPPKRGFRTKMSSFSVPWGFVLANLFTKWDFHHDISF